ncbi:MAG: hypothetical protein IT258_14935 [Saprospiraceae bacterium]|nr:hypothetical protein [Saprospiraceae bacterium]
MKKLLPILILLLVLLLGFLFIKRNGPSDSPTAVWEQETEAKIEAIQLFDEFLNDETGANEKYLNKIIEVSGEVSTVRSNEAGTSVILKTNDPALGVRCRFERNPGKELERYSVGQHVRLKCLCSGMVQDVELVQCKEK